MIKSGQGTSLSKDFFLLAVASDSITFTATLKHQNVQENNVSMSHLEATPLPKNHSAKSPSSKDQIVGTKSFHFKFVPSQSGTAEPHLDICQQIFSHLLTLILLLLL